MKKFVILQSSLGKAANYAPFLLVLMLLSPKPTRAQTSSRSLALKVMSLLKIGRPQSALVANEKLEAWASKNKNIAAQIQGAVFHLRILSQLDGDNESVASINWLEKQIPRASYPLKSILQSMLGQAFWEYSQNNRYSRRERNHMQHASNDVSQWDTQTILNQAAYFFDLSLQEVIKEQNTPVGILGDVLEGDAQTRYLRPTLYDLLLHRALDFFQDEEVNKTKRRSAFTPSDLGYFSDSRAFAEWKTESADSSSASYKSIKYLQQGTIFHLNDKNKAALADLDLQRLKYVYTLSRLQNKDSLFVSALKLFAKSFSSTSFSSEALSLVGKIYMKEKKNANALAFFKQAAKAYPKSEGGLDAGQHIKQIMQPQMKAMIEGLNVPGKPLLAGLSYCNLKSVKITLYKVWSRQYDTLNAMGEVPRYRSGASLAKQIDAYLKALKPFRTDTLHLPLANDYTTHTTEFKIDSLPMGIYILVLQDLSSENKQARQLVSFNVTRIAYARRQLADERLQIVVTDRETGAPLRGAQVTIDAIWKQNSDANGMCYFNLAAFNLYPVKLTLASDTLYAEKFYLERFADGSETIDQNRVVLFTDREIYRPGQTIFFKGIYLRTSGGKNSLLPNEKISYAIDDRRNKVLNWIPVTTNKFASFSGSYKIPKNGLNGFISITTPYDSKRISIEEYKRPNFNVRFLPIAKRYKPGDSVTLKGIVRAYSGYGLSRARVAVEIQRHEEKVDDSEVNQEFDQLNLQTEAFLSDTITSNERGEFSIKFKAAPEENHAIRSRYNIQVSVTSGGGETRSEETSLLVYSKDIMLSSTVPSNLHIGDSMKIITAIQTLNHTPQAGEITLRVYALKSPGVLFKNRLWGLPDTYLLSKEAYKKDFPEYAYDKEDLATKWPILQKIKEIRQKVDDTKPAIVDQTIFSGQATGVYKINICAKTTNGDTLARDYYINVFNKPAKPLGVHNWVTYVGNRSGKEDSASFFVGAGSPSNVLIEKIKEYKLLYSKWLHLEGTVQQEIKVPIDTGASRQTVRFFTMLHNRNYTQEQAIQKIDTNKRLSIGFFSFRDKLQPGEKEKWMIKISGNNAQPVEMAADLYDASLDVLSTSTFHPETIPQTYEQHVGYHWRNLSNAVRNSYSFLGKYNPVYLDFTPPVSRKYKDISSRLNESMSTRAAIPPPLPAYKSVISFDRALSSDLSPHEVGLTEKSVQWRAGETINIPSNRHSYPTQVGLSEVTTRKNFSETAFFYPQLLSDKQGNITLDFKMPESLTTWHFWAFAHTKELKTAFLENSEIITQKKLSIIGNTPRFLREGDTISVSATLANLTDSELKGKVQLCLFNGLNRQPLNMLSTPTDSIQGFSLKGRSNKPVSFKLVIPPGIAALSYRLTATAGQYSDGEENTLSVLSANSLVSESMPMMVLGGKTKAFKLKKLLEQNSKTLQNKSLTLEYTQNPAWYALQALPYMMEFPYECSEQIFNRYYANSFASAIVNSQPVIKKVFAQWTNAGSKELLSTLEKNQNLKEELLEESPWLREAQNETEQKRRIALLFDLNAMQDQLSANLEKLKEKQLPDGSFPWFGGSEGDRYITQYILAGMGQLYQLKMVEQTNQDFKSMADKAIAYLEQEQTKEANRGGRKYISRLLSPLEIHCCYAQSYFASRTWSLAAQKHLDNYLKLAAMQWPRQSVYEQAMIALTMLRNKRPETASIILTSLKERAQHSEDLGMYWEQNRPGYYWYESPIEVQSLLIELFTEVGGNEKDIEEMKTWLLCNKRTSNWSTTKATASACYALLMKGSSGLVEGTNTDITIGGKPLAELKPGLKTDAGIGYIKATWADKQITPSLGEVVLKNKGKTLSWGALHWQYLEKLDKITSAQTNIHLERKYYIERQSSNGVTLVDIDATHQPKVGDLLKVVIHLVADRDFDYVQMKDMRASGTEPVDVISEYKYQDGLSYYQVTKDIATNFFMSSLQKGNYVFEYELRVNQPGNFASGITSIQSMYAPEFNAHSSGERMKVLP